jgi:putative oxidoreductase
MEARLQDRSTSFGLLVLRVGVGVFMATHGWGKLQQVLDGNFKFADPIGIGPTASLLLLTGAEFFGALFVALGLATRYAAAALAFAMGVAAFVAHGNDPWSMETAVKAYFAKESETFSSKEPALLYLIPFLALVFTGAGRYSLDAWIGARRALRKT